MTTKKKAGERTTKPKPAVNHKLVAWVLAGVLWHTPESKDAQNHGGGQHARRGYGRD